MKSQNSIQYPKIGIQKLTITLRNCLIILFVILSNVHVFAQLPPIYKGGNADGFAYNSITQTTCTPLVGATIFYGGNTDGFAYNSITQTTCTPLISANIFYGGNTDGFAYNALTQTCPLPCNVTASFTSSDSTICTGESISFTNTGSGATSYLWQEDGTTFSTSSNTSKTFNTAGTPTIRLIASDSSCSDTSELIITVKALPVVNIGNDTSLCSGNSITLDAGTGFTTYLWSTGATTQAITIDSVGSYSVTVTDTNDCSNSDAITISICSGINQFHVSSSMFIVYPNPNDGEFSIVCQMADSKCQKAKVVIYNPLGEIVYQSKITNQSSKIQNSKFKINNGIYYLQLITNEGVWNEKIIVN